MRSHTITIAFILSLSICDATLLWRINVNPPAYLLGTVHLPWTEIWPSLSDAAKSAFNESTHFMPEFDMTNFFAFTRFRMCLMTRLPVLGRNGPSPPPGFTNHRDNSAPILDMYLTMEARQMGKTVSSLESVETYCEFTKFQVESLTNNFTINLNQSSLLNNETNALEKQIYNCDLNEHGEFLTALVVNNGDKALLAFKERLDIIVGHRDTLMARKIDSLLKEATSKDRFFFAIGFNHLMNSKGIVTKLREDYKYSITRLCTDQPQNRAHLNCQGPSWCDPIAGL